MNAVRTDLLSLRDDLRVEVARERALNDQMLALMDQLLKRVERLEAEEEVRGSADRTRDEALGRGLALTLNLQQQEASRSTIELFFSGMIFSLFLCLVSVDHGCACQRNVWVDMTPHILYGGLMLELTYSFSSSRVVLHQEPCGLFLGHEVLLGEEVSGVVCGRGVARPHPRPGDHGHPGVGSLWREGAGGHQLAVLLLGAVAWPSAPR